MAEEVLSLLGKKDGNVDKASAQPEGQAGRALHGKLEDMAARVGDVLLLQLKTSYGDERAKVRLVGYAVGKTVMVEAPGSAGSFVAVREGQSLIVRSFSRKLAYGFSTTVLKACSAPLPYLHLAYPEFVQKAAVRESARVAFSIIGMASRLDGESGEVPFPVLLVDFSTTGAAFTAPANAATRSGILRLSFRVKIQEIEVLPVVECIVRSCAPVDDDASAKHRYGVQFRDLKTQDLLVLQSMVFQKMLEQA